LFCYYGTKTRMSSTCSPAVEPRGRRFAGEPDGPVGPQWFAHGGQAALRCANTVAAAPPDGSARRRRRSIRLRSMQLQSRDPSSIAGQENNSAKTIEQGNPDVSTEIGRSVADYLGWRLQAANEPVGRGIAMEGGRRSGNCSALAGGLSVWSSG
jgi:hypothetical protein